MMSMKGFLANARSRAMAEIEAPVYPEADIMDRLLMDPPQNVLELWHEWWNKYPRPKEIDVIIPMVDIDLGETAFKFFEVTDLDGRDKGVGKGERIIDGIISVPSIMIDALKEELKNLWDRDGDFDQWFEGLAIHPTEPKIFKASPGLMAWKDFYNNSWPQSWEYEVRCLQNGGDIE